MAKTPPGDFKVITLENPLLSKQAITSKGIGKVEFNQPFYWLYSLSNLLVF